MSEVPFFLFFFLTTAYVKFFASAAPLPPASTETEKNPDFNKQQTDKNTDRHKHSSSVSSHVNPFSQTSLEDFIFLLPQQISASK